MMSIAGTRSSERVRKFRKMHPAHVMHMTGPHLGAVCRDDLAQLWDRQDRAMFRQQAVSA